MKYLHLASLTIQFTIAIFHMILIIILPEYIAMKLTTIVWCFIFGIHSLYFYAVETLIKQKGE